MYTLYSLSATSLRMLCLLYISTREKSLAVSRVVNNFIKMRIIASGFAIELTLLKLRTRDQ